MKKNPISKNIIVILFISGFFWNLNHHIWKDKNVFSQDSFLYYAYLPLTFVDHDISLKQDHPKTGIYNSWLLTSPTDTRFTKMTMGIAILETPFFFIADGIASIFEFPRDGFSLPYQIVLCMSSLVYAAIGFVFLRKILLKYFNDYITAITLLSIAIGTNLFCYVYIEPLMSHAFSFCLFAIFLLEVIKWHENTSWMTSFLLAVTGAFITLIRPTNVLVLIVFLLYNVKSLADLKEKFSFFVKRRKSFLLMIPVAFLVFLPQLIYWKLVSGQYIFYSYLDKNEVQSQFITSHAWLGLFSYRKGWLVYTPLMSFSLIGFVSLFKKAKEFFFALSVFMMLFIYIVFSWWQWWYGGGFGGRPMIEAYAFLSLPLAAFYHAAFKRMVAAIIVTMATSFFIYLNLFQTWQYRITLIHWSDMTKEAYWSVFLKTNFPPDYLNLLKPPENELQKNE